MIRHLLLIKFVLECKPSDIESVRTLFLGLANKIDGIEGLEWGSNNSPENLNKGYTHSVLMSFRDEQAREDYLPHPEHEALKAVFVPLLDDIVVFDYSAEGSG